MKTAILLIKILDNKEIWRFKYKLWAGGMFDGFLMRMAEVKVIGL